MMPGATRKMPRDPPRFFIQSSPDPSASTPRAPRPTPQPFHLPLSSTSLASTSSTSEWGPHPSLMSRGLTSVSEMSSAKIDALSEIHRVLYRGKEGEESRDVDWETQGREVQRVIERWFEGDCVYDHPLARVSSRQSLLAHFILLNLLSTMYLPTLTPSSVIHYIRQMILGLRSRQSTEGEKDRALATGGEEERLGLSGSAREDRNWWKLYDVTADCKEIGAMECYAMIEHVITLTFFPSFLGGPSPGSPSFESLPSQSSFSRRLAMVILHELSDVLRWDIPISTTVHFNEVGKATHIRDSIDVRDLIETFVPFAKRIGWLTRRVSGALTSTLGTIALKAVQERMVASNEKRRLRPGSDRSYTLNEKMASEPCVEKSLNGLGIHPPLNEISQSDPRTTATAPPTYSPTISSLPASQTGTVRGNSLGLGGVDTATVLPTPRAAPDIDGGR